SFDHHACFLVFATVDAWDETVLAGPVRGVSEFEVVLAEAATGSRGAEPLPFRITGHAERVAYHVLDKRDGLPHTLALHEREGALCHRAAGSRDLRLVVQPPSRDLHADGRQPSHARQDVR